MTEPANATVCPHCGAPCDDAETRYCGRCGTEVRRPGRDDPALSRTSPSGVHDYSDRSDPLIGRVIDGRYRVQARIGQGGMGVVYRVEHVAMGKVAALKMLHPSLSQEAEVVRRFRREAEAVSRLSHPNTVQVFDFGQADGSMYLVMELVRGEDLGAILRRDGPFAWKRLGPILTQVLDALAEAHELGVIHRDLKPENLLVSRARDGRDLVKVLDFGLAKLRDVEELNAVTGRGTVIGTPYYMSPEQIRAEDLDARSDLYSLGAVAYRSLTGEHPFAAATPVAVLTQHLTTHLERPRARAPEREIPQAADAIVVKAMEKKQGDRYQSAEEMKKAIEAASSAASEPGLKDGTRRESDAAVSAVSAMGVAERLRREDFDGYERGLRLRRWLALSIVPLVLVLAGAGGFFYLRQDHPKVLEEEVEPNDDPATANAIASGQPIRGHVGKRRTQEESDRDFYHLVVDKPGSRITAEVSGIPEMDLILQVFDGQGHEIAESETGAEGDAEAIFDLRADPGDYYVQVREVWVSGQNATENVSDAYSLKASVDAIAPNEELEPNNEPAIANPMGAGPMIGRLTHPGDIDCYTVPAPAPTSLSAAVTGLPGVELRLSLLPQGGKLGQKAAGVRVADSRTGDAAKLDKAAWPPGLSAPVVCVERRDHPVARDKVHVAHTEHSPHVALPSRSATYSLSVDAQR
jgi:serine/threonine protein kinase